MKNHLGEKTYRTYRGWLRAVKAKAATMPGTFLLDGDKDIASAFVVNGNKQGLGEWDGSEGSIYLPRT